MIIYKILYDKNDKKIYEGGFESDNREGRGTMYYENGNIKYTGEWENDKPNGIGVLFHENGKKFYEGKWKLGKANGQGVLFNKNEKIEYEGQFKDSKKQGIGTMYFSDGTKYNGEWDNDEINGFGSLFYNSGQLMYRGYFRNSKKDGRGALIDENNILIYQGSFRNNKRYGNGKSYYDNGVLQYSGEWKDDLMDGEGTFYNEDGEKEHIGIFKNGIIIKEIKINEFEQSLNSDINLDNNEYEITTLEITNKKNNFEEIEEIEEIEDLEEIEEIEDLEEIEEIEDLDREKKTNECKVENKLKKDNNLIQDKKKLSDIDNIFFNQIKDKKNNIVDRKISDDKNEDIKLCSNSDKDIEKDMCQIKNDISFDKFINKKNDTLENLKNQKICIKENDLVYEGYFDEFNKTGKGSIFCENNKIFDGELVMGLYHGKGKLYDLNETLIYKGNFKDGKKNGFGKSYDSSGHIIYEGEWKEDLQHGKGKLLNSKGEEIFNGVFHKGKALGLINSIESQIDNILYDELEQMIGLEEVKDDIARLISFIKMQILRRRMSCKIMDIPYIFTFEGNIGIGKEQVAKILGKLYYVLGLIPEYNFIQKDLLEALAYSHNGEIEKSLDNVDGGVLYLSNLYENEFEGTSTLINDKEAINNILDLIEYSNGHFVIIFSGNEDLIETMIHNKKELAKLIGKSISFFDYSVEEMIEYIKKISTEKDYKLSTNIIKELENYFSDMIEDENFTSRNSEFLNEMFIELVKEQCIRIDNDGISDIEELRTIKVSDLHNIKQKICF